MSTVLTEEGLEKLKKELSEIKDFKLKEAAKRIKEAKDLGDLSENAEYHEAKNEQAFLYSKALEIENKILNAEIIKKGVCHGVVLAGCKVVVENESGEKKNFEIVGSEESDPVNGRISISSPIGSALSGHKRGDNVIVKTPRGEIKFTIIEIV